MTTRTLTFDGCATRHDAEARLREWLELIHADAVRQFGSGMLLEHELDVDLLDTLLTEMADANALARERVVRTFNTILDRACPDQP